jgi:hypothetical protein
MFRHGLAAIAILASAFVSSSAFAEERLGTLEVSDLFLEPRFGYEEGSFGGFEPGNSLVSFRWIRDQVVSATVTAGTQELVGRPRRYVPESSDELTLAEAFIEARSSLGIFRFGRISLPFGTESGRPESALRFTRSRLMRERWLGLRDQGLSYSVEHRGFFNDWAVHNGESGRSLDNQTWITARWGWADEKQFTGFSGSTGRTKPSSTQVTSAPLRTTADAGLDPNLDAKIRFGNVFYTYEGFPFGWGIEATAGETRQAGQTSLLRAAHVDAQYYVTHNVSFLARWDYLEPSNKILDDRVEDSTIGMSWRGWYETSTLYFFLSRVGIQGTQDNNHQALIVWRLTPVGRGEK